MLAPCRCVVLTFKQPFTTHSKLTDRILQLGSSPPSLGPCTRTFSQTGVWVLLPPKGAHPLIQGQYYPFERSFAPKVELTERILQLVTSPFSECCWSWCCPVFDAVCVVLVSVGDVVQMWYVQLVIVVAASVFPMCCVCLVWVDL